NRELPLIIGQLQVLPRHWWQERDLSRRDTAPVLEDIAVLETAEDGRSITVTLNEGEGLPSAEDVGPSWDAQEAPAAGTPTFRIEDARRLVVALDEPATAELLTALRTLKVLPAKRDFTRTSLEPPLGSGPYRIASFAAGRSVRYERIRDWWAADLPVTRGLYNFDA